MSLGTAHPCPIDLAVFGNLLVDDIVYADGTTRMGQAGGAVLYFALAGWLCGLRVGIVSVRGDDYPSDTLDALEKRGIDLAGVRPLGKPGLRTWLLDEGAKRQVVHRLEGPRHDTVTPRFDDLPESWHRAAAFHLAPMPMLLQHTLVRALKPLDGLLSLDPYALLRDGDQHLWRELLEGLDLFFVSEDEVLLSGDASEGLAALAPTTHRVRILHKRGKRGGVLIDGERRIRWWPRVASVVDPTGAGDAFAAGYLAGHLRREGVERSLQWGVVAASFAIEAPGVEKLLHASPEEARQRFSEWFEETP